MKMPDLDISGGGHEFVAGLVEDHGRSLRGDGYEVALADGTREVVVLGADTLHGSQKVVDALKKLLTGGGLFADTEVARVDVAGIPPDTQLRALLGDHRISNALARGAGIETLGQLVDMLDDPDGDRKLDIIPGIGKQSIVAIRAALGR